ETLAAYESWTSEHGLPRLTVPVAMQPGEQSAFRAARRLLTAKTPPDAIFAVAERFVRGVLRAASACGTQVPGELLLAGGVAGAEAGEGDPPATALELHPGRQAEAGVELLLARLNGDEAPAPTYIPATLHVRASTGAPHRAGPAGRP